jgi:hypothetical protein
LGTGNCGVGAAGLRKAGDASSGRRMEERLLRRTERGLWSERKMAR